MIRPDSIHNKFKILVRIKEQFSYDQTFHYLFYLEIVIGISFLLPLEEYGENFLRRILLLKFVCVFGTHILLRTT